MTCAGEASGATGAGAVVQKGVNSRYSGYA